MEYAEYMAMMIERFWQFKKKHFKNEEHIFEQTYEQNPQRPPVFKRELGDKNVLLHLESRDELKCKVKTAIPMKRWHRWFTSMTSSQALAQSVFGNLKAYGKLNILADVISDDGKPPFGFICDNGNEIEMEKVILYLGESRQKTHIDVFFGGPHQITVECKLTEQEIGPCSRPRLRKSAPNYEKDYCDGNYVIQRKREERCSLTEIGVRYWDYIPDYLNWDPTIDFSPCPLNSTYQLVRNILAACLKPKSGSESETEKAEGHAVLLYDARNPEFKQNGKGWQGYAELKDALKDKSLLRSCTWQDIIRSMAKNKDLDWLREMLREKYGLEA